MFTLKGKYNYCHIMAPWLDDSTTSQIFSFLNHPALREYTAIMADAHAGNGACIGYTAKLGDSIVPGMVGVDIGCGIYAFKLHGVNAINFETLDNFIRNNVPYGKGGNQKYYNVANESIVRACKTTAKKINFSLDLIGLQIGTLGGGNHFIEVDIDEDGCYWLVVHTGSRKFGFDIAKYHQDKAKKLMKSVYQGDAYKDLEYLPMDFGGREYLEDMKVAQAYAHDNRYAILSRILMGYFGFKTDAWNWIGGKVESVHNYIDFTDNIIRKGAIQANTGQRVIIPLNMSDGSLIADGKGCGKWNNSAPHGAGRIMSRKQAKSELNMEDYEKSMEGIWTSCVSRATLDESKAAYKDPQLIIDAIDETVGNIMQIKPVYNFKSDK